jgi:hypothetical protein
MADMRQAMDPDVFLSVDGDDRQADAGRVSEEIVCSECGSNQLVASGVFEHGTWIHRLTCWTCLDCQTIVAVAEPDALATAEAAPSSVAEPES